MENLAKLIYGHTQYTSGMAEPALQQQQPAPPRRPLNNDTQSNDSFKKKKPGPMRKKHPNKSSMPNYENIRRLFRSDIQDEPLKSWQSFFIKYPQIFYYLELNCITFLEQNTREHQPWFKCRLCSDFFNTLEEVNIHVDIEPHSTNVEEHWETTSLRLIPMISRSHEDTLTDYLKSVFAKQCMRDDDDCANRLRVCKQINNDMQSLMPGCAVTVYGSTLHKLGLRSADINLVIAHPDGVGSEKALSMVATFLEQEHYCVTRDFTDKFPSVSFTTTEPDFRIVMSLNNDIACQLSLLLSKYTYIDQRARIIISLFRLWGQMARVDNSDGGSWTPYVLYIMAIFYLQQCKPPVLPVLQEVLRHKCTPINVLKDVDPVHVPKLVAATRWRARNNQSVAHLWIGLLRFYAVEFDPSEAVIAIHTSSKLTRYQKSWFSNKNFFAVVEPVTEKINLARSVDNSATNDYITKSLKHVYKYFAIPQTGLGPIIGGIRSVPEANIENFSSNYRYAMNFMTDQLAKKDKLYNPPSECVQSQFRNVNEVIEFAVTKTVTKSDLNNLINLCNKLQMNNDLPLLNMYLKLYVFTSDAKLLFEHIKPSSLKFDFNRAASCGKLPPLICKVCKLSGHKNSNCPDEKLVSCEPRPLNEATSITLSRLCYTVFEKYKLYEPDIIHRAQIVRSIESFIQTLYSNTTLTLFGSSVNGFGFKNSDLDLCLKFTDEKFKNESKMKATFIEDLCKQLTKFPELNELHAISTAKVPIIKFVHKQSKLEGDISLYNTLAQENTKLLLKYVEIDSRVQILGFMLKLLAKQCEIGTAAKGSLSSYGYSLMVIYFLQRCNPPVVPVLQEIGEGSEMIDDINVYYYKDLDNLSKVWKKDKERNTCIVGELWVQLLHFYGHEFDFLNLVVSIRTLQDVTKFSKLWNSKCIAIEDPFDTSHNLGSALSRSMSVYILKTVRSAWNHFSAPVCPIEAVEDQLMLLYFFGKEVADGKPPNDRGCKFCDSIGHKVKDCPVKQQRIKEKAQDKMRRNRHVRNERRMDNGNGRKARDDMDVLRLHVHHKRKEVPEVEIAQNRISSLTIGEKQGQSQMMNPAPTRQPCVPATPKHMPGPSTGAVPRQQNPRFVRWPANANVPQGPYTPFANTSLSGVCDTNFSRRYSQNYQVRRPPLPVPPPLLPVTLLSNRHFHHFPPRVSRRPMFDTPHRQVAPSQERSAVDSHLLSTQMYGSAVGNGDWYNAVSNPPSIAANEHNMAIGGACEQTSENSGGNSTRPRRW